MYVERNSEELSPNHCTIYSECVFVALGIRHAMRKCHIVICGLSGSKIFLHNIS